MRDKNTERGTFLMHVLDVGRESAIENSSKPLYPYRTPQSGKDDLGLAAP